MTPRFGFGATERLLPEHEGVATVTHASPAGSDPVEIGGRWSLGFSLKPTPRVTWSLEPDDATGSAISVHEGAGLRVRLPHSPDLELLRTSLRLNLAAAASLSGILPAYEPEGDITVTDVRFDVINWGGVLGATYTRYDEPLQMTLNRHQWSSDVWQITLDGDPDLKQSWESARDNRGFTVTHCGRVTRADGQPFAFREASEVLGCLHWFLSLVRGRRVGIALATGFATDPGLQPREEPLITHWGVTHVDEAAAAQSWFTLGVEHELDGLFQSFHRVWRDDEALARQLRTMISAYCVALDHSIPIDMRVLAGYIGLETETTKNLNKPVLKAILAGRHLPDRISHTVHGSGQPFSGSKLLTKTRNAVVHQNTGDYPTVDRLSRACNTCLYFLELLMLRKLGHEGTFCDRFQATHVGMRSDMPNTGTG